MHMTPSKMSAGFIVLTLAILLGLQPVTTDLYLPALPGLTQDLGAAMSRAQLTLTALLLSFGISQLVWGPLSDRFGRRPVLLIGLAAYTLSAVGSALSASMESLILWRSVQGAAMGAGVMCARAVVRDLYQPSQGATVMSKGLSGLGLIACASPPLGGLLTALFSWHAALLALAAYGAVAWAILAWRFEETLAAPNLDALQLHSLLNTWKGILRNPTFLAFTALSVASYVGLFTFLATSSFVFIKVLGYSTTQYGLCVFLNAFVYLLGTILCRSLIKQFGIRKTVAIAGGMSLVAALSIATLHWSNGHSGLAIMVPMGFFMLGHGIHQPCGQSGAVGPFPLAAGAASALNGFLMMVGAFVMGQWLGAHMDGSALPLVQGICFSGVWIALIAWTLVQRHAPS
jgi:DHA1 family bicyclomycin/chloramphenicol resistance-like MFS transporter